MAEPEISLFGPGIGECVVVHLGGGEWLVVDSCVDPATKRPVALDYLNRLGVDLAKQVKLIVVSHWHNDHIRGAAQLLNACSQAKFACSIALNNREFKTLLKFPEDPLIDDSGVEEFRSIIDVLYNRSRQNPRFSPGPDVWAISGRELYAGGQSSVVALSPSDATCTHAIAAFAKLIPSKGQPKRRLVSQTPNDMCTVLRVNVAGQGFLLGSDLEVSTDPKRGWSAILDLPQPQRATCFKVAHHGSQNAHEDRVWAEMLESHPVAMVTPFRTGHRPLPSEADRARILSLTSRAYCTAPLQQPRKHFGDSAVKKLVRRQTVSDVRELVSPMGQIRLRIRNGQQDIELLGGARHLKLLTG